MDVASNNPLQVLLVEDNPGDVMLITGYFKESISAPVMHVVSDGNEATAFLQQQKAYTQAPRPNLILLDLSLPGKSGWEVLAEIKADPRLRDIPVIALTTCFLDEEVTRAYNLRANCLISKPLVFEEYMRILKAIDDFWLGAVTYPVRR